MLNRQGVGRCRTRGESQGERTSYMPPPSANKAIPTLTLKPRGDIIRSAKNRGISGLIKGHVFPKKF